MTPSQREKIPTHILTKLIRRDGKVTTKKLTFMQQMYILSQAGLSTVFFVIENGDNGLGVVEYEKFKKKYREKKSDLFQAEEYVREGCLIFSNEDFTEWLTHINRISLSGAMNYTLKLKNTITPKIIDKETEFKYIANMLLKYDCSKKKMIRKDDLQVPDWYVLLYLADGEEKGATAAYSLHLIDAFNASRQQIMHSFKKMVLLKYVQAIGNGKNTVYKITYLGKSIIGEMLKKYIIP